MSERLLTARERGKYYCTDKASSAAEWGIGGTEVARSFSATLRVGQAFALPSARMRNSEAVCGWGLLARGDPSRGGVHRMNVTISVRQRKGQRGFVTYWDNNCTEYYDRRECVLTELRGRGDSERCSQLH